MHLRQALCSVLIDNNELLSSASCLYFVLMHCSLMCHSSFVIVQRNSNAIKIHPNIQAFTPNFNLISFFFSIFIIESNIQIHIWISSTFQILRSDNSFSCWSSGPGRKILLKFHLLIWWRRRHKTP